MKDRREDNEEYLDLEDIDESEEYDNGGSNNGKYEDHEDGYLMGESEESKKKFDSYLKKLEDESGFSDLKKHRDVHGTAYDTGENFRRDYYSSESDEDEGYDFSEDDEGDGELVFLDKNNTHLNDKKSYNKGYSLKDEVSKYGGSELITNVEKGILSIDDALGNKTKTGNKNIDRSIEAIRSAIEYDIDRAVEKDKERLQRQSKEIGRVPTERDFQRLEDRHKRKKAESMRKNVASGIKTARTKENRQKFKAFMESKEVKLALNLIGVFGGAYGKGFVKAVQIFTFVWTLNFGVVLLALFGLVALLGFIMVSSVFVVVMTLTEDDIGEEVEVGEEVQSASVEVPEGYDGKFMYPVEKTLRSSRGYTGVGGHLGQDISGAGENVYPIYPGKVILSGKGKPQCNNSGGSKCSTLKNDAQGITFYGDGNAVQVAHDLGDGKYVISYYMHMAPGSITVEEGDKVGYGTPVGKVGNSGNSYGAHLHIEVYDNVPKGFFDNGRKHYATDYNWYGKLTNKTIAPPPLWTCGGKSGVAVNSAGMTNTPQSCVDDAKVARSK